MTEMSKLQAAYCCHWQHLKYETDYFAKLPKVCDNGKDSHPILLFPTPFQQMGIQSRVKSLKGETRLSKVRMRACLIVSENGSKWFAHLHKDSWPLW